MAPPTIAAAIVRFKNEAPLETQEESLCLALVDELKNALRCIPLKGFMPHPVERNKLRASLHIDPLAQDRSLLVDEFSETERRWIHDAIDSMKPFHNATTAQKGDVAVAHWFPQYAGALQMECIGVGLLSVRVIALDGWERRLHFPRSGGCIHSAVPTTHSAIYCGRLDSRKVHEFTSDLQGEIVEASKRKGSERSAANTETPGHQKTPTFLASLVQNTLDKQRGKSNAKRRTQGGMTDVGKHTGGAPRDTCWGLVAAVLKQSLPGNSYVFERFRIVLLEHLLGQTLKPTSPSMTAWDTVDHCFQILDAIVLAGLELQDAGYKVSSLQEKCSEYRNRLDSLAVSWIENRQPRYQFASDSAIASMKSEDAAMHELEPPQAASVLQDGDATSTADWKTVIANLMYEFINGRSAAAVATSQAITKFSPRANRSKLSTLRAIELALFQASESLQAQAPSPFQYRVKIYCDWSSGTENRWWCSYDARTTTS